MSDRTLSIADLTPEQLAKLQARLRALRGEASAPAGIPRRAGAGPVPLSFAQLRIWIHDQLDPGAVLFNLPLSLRLRGDLDVVALRRALGEIVRRHEALRTTFEAGEDGPVQVIHPAAGVSLDEADLSAEPDPAAEAERRAAAETSRPFALEREAPFRAALLRVGPREHLLAMVLHHIVFDAWASGVLLRELAALYDAYSRGAPSPLAEPALQFADFAVWERERMRGETLARLLDFWKAHLEGAPAALDLPADRPRAAGQPFEAVKHPVRVPAERVDALRRVARSEGATLYAVFLAAYLVVLRRFTGADDLVVGSFMAGRTRPETEALLGTFANTLVLRFRVEGAPRFRALVRQVRETMLKAAEHQDLPFERLVEALQPAREAGRVPLVQTAFNLPKVVAPALDLPGLSVEAVPVPGAAAGVDLHWMLEEVGDEVRGMLEYDARVYAAGTAAALVGLFDRVLEEAAARPDASIDALALLAGGERRRVLVEWNAAAHDFPRGERVHDLFAAQAARTPEAPALVFRGAVTTYAELEARANRLAHHLRGLGVGPEVRVGICLDRAPELIVSLLAVLKAGGAYVPLDPAYPRERLGWMIEDAAIRLVLTTTPLADRLPEGAEPVRLDAIAGRLASESSDAPESGVDAESLSHVIFTSGSTGRPKGVMVRHSATVALLRWMRGEVADEERASVLGSTSTSFDVSVAEIFNALCWGGKLVLAENALELPAVADQEIRYVSMVPTAAAELLRSGGIPASVRTVNLAGEALTLDLARALYALGTVEKVRNLYGPTEDTSYSTCSVVARDAERVLIGRALAGSRAYVLDGALQPLPACAAGELFLAGAGVARGYEGRPGLTAERFLPDPFGGEAGARMYRTGDRARWTAEGELEYLGRIDFQVKVRGFRIEPGEIETALRTHEGVGEAVVVAREDAWGDRRLVAYVVPASGAEAPPAAALRAHLKERLPEHMVPSAFVALGAFPRTGSGKIDRKALPAPDASRAEAAAYVAPRTDDERLLAGLFAEVLGVERVGVDDDFFALGGHSLLATRVVTRLRSALGVELPLRALFDRPSVAAMAERVRAAAVSGAPPLVPVRRDGPLPLSFAQRRLWFIDQMEPGSPAYHLPYALRLRGPLDVAVLERAMTEIVRRHEVLRTRFPSVDGEPSQAIGPAGPFHLDLTDLSSIDGAAREAALHALAAEAAARPFDLARGPLLRAALARVDEGEHVLLVTLHHAVSDGWSTGILARELSALYAAFARGEASPLAELPVQYADYAAWQRAWLSGEVLEAQLAWWRGALAGAPRLLELPTDRPRPRVAGHDGGTVRFTLPPETTGALDALARREGATRFMALLAAWQFLLSRHAGQDDVSVGSPIAGRTRLETEGLIGFFANTLVLRADLSCEPSFRALLGRVRETTLGAYQHQDLPFEKLVEALVPERSLSHAPLFQVMLALQDEVPGTLRLGDVEAEPVAMAEESAKFDLSLTLGEMDGVVTGALVYRAELFDAATVERMAEHFRALLAGVVAEPDLPVSRIVMLGEAERRRVLEEWNATDAGSGALPVPTAFAMRAARTPDAVAVRAPDATLTYAELECRANRLARHLLRRGVGPEARVGVSLERSAELVVALLGVMKAGAAYLPLDAAYPAERLAYMLADAGVSLLLADSETAGRLPAGGVETLLLDAARDEIARERDDAPEGEIDPESLAYVIYTSGSTGRPKGAALPHRALSNHMAWMQRAYPLRADDRVLQKTPLSFDASVWEFWAPLLAGATLVVGGPETHRDPAALARAVEAGGVTVLQLVPSLLRAVLDAGALDGARSLVRLFCGGEALPADLAARAREALGAEVVNLYGPTEACIDATSHAYAGAAGVTVPIGRPVDNVRAYVLGRAGEPAPVGAPGELYLGGAQLARGYLDRPALTAEKFVPDPFGAPGARLYRTGDRARWLSDGTLECLGRADQQVKVRGFRIEPGEIEAALERHPEVREAAVAARGGDTGDARLVGYVVPAGDTAPSPAGLRAYLAERLPEHMVPAALVVLPALPRTPNGKLDAAALPAPDFAAGAGAYAAPATPAEEIVAGMFAEVLEVASVGAADSFFALGGHSLLATRLVSRVRETFRVELPLRALFEAPTVAGLAARVDALAREARGPAAPPLVPVPRDGALPLSFAQQRLWFLHQLDPSSAAYHIPFALRLRGALDVAALERSLEEIVRRHEPLRTRFPRVDGEPAQVIDPAGPVSLSVADLRHLAGPEREDAVREMAAGQASRPFDLASGPLFRGALARVGEEEHLLFLTLHHIVSDGWSTGVLVREASALYDAFSRGLPSPLAPLAVQYADYAAWQRAWLSGEVLEAQLAWWRGALAGAPRLLELPTDRPRPRVAGHDGGSVRFTLPAETTRALDALARREGATRFMALLAGWQLLLSRYAGEDDVSVGTPIAGRTRLETEGLIGIFANTLVLRADLSGAPSFRALLARVRETTLGAYGHQDLPFERLVEALVPERSLSHTPLFQVMFAFQDEVSGTLRLGGVEAEPVATEAQTTKFDLSLTLGAADGMVVGALAYRTELFDRGTVERMVEHYAALLAGVVAAPDLPAAALPLLGETERRVVVEAWNATAMALPTGRCVHERFAAWAARAPEAAAVVFGAETLIYAELDARSSRLAHHLRSLGVGPDARVGICLERGVEMVVAVLGILKAGGAYVPLDPSDPEARLRFLVDDVGAAAVVTRAALVSRLAPFAGPVVRLDADAEAIGRAPAELPESGVAPENVAYVIYTSGSTGKPKGVLVEHRNLANYLGWFDREVLGGRGYALPLVSRLSFDAHVRPLFVPLLRGEPVWVLAEETVADPAALLEALAERPGASFSGVPSLWRALLERLRADGAAAPPGLKAIAVGGEAIPPEVVEETRARFPGVPVWNHYGPTETTVNVSVARLDTGDRVTIGRPLANVRAYVLDAWLNPLPAGVPGELCAGGAGVARGYHGRPALTAERFLPDPFSPLPGARMYRTGDRARWTAAGELEYLGRADEQVKVRGVRIEPGEVEAALQAHPAVREAVVVARDDARGERRLVGYAVAREAEVSLDDLRAHLRARLPEHMVPTAFVVLDALPLMPSGKVDRRALPAPDEAGGRTYVAPRTPAEERVAAIWAEVLGVERVGLEDDFFVLGGHSLRATRVVAQVGGALGVEVPVRTLFEAPTLEAFVGEVARAATIAGTALPAIVTRSRAEEALAGVDAMSEAELDRLLNTLSTEEEAEW